MSALARSEKELRRKIEAAQVAAATLKGSGAHFEAEQVLTLCRTASSLLALARQQHAQIEHLRAEIVNLNSDALHAPDVAKIAGRPLNALEASTMPKRDFEIKKGGPT